VVFRDGETFLVVSAETSPIPLSRATLVAPVTVQLKVVALPCVIVAGFAVNLTMVGTAETATVALLDLLGSTWLVAVTVSVQGEDGAVYKPVPSMVPIAAVQVRAWFVVPLMAAVNCFCSPRPMSTALGLMVTEMPRVTINVL
jgi:hypothetical protein